MGLIQWYKECKRAKKVGETFIGHWHDPETGKLWMCRSRYGMRTMDDDTVESVATMCHFISYATLTEYGISHLPPKYQRKY